jgi:hypothetical protein
MVASAAVLMAALVVATLLLTGRIGPLSAPGSTVTLSPVPPGASSSAAPSGETSAPATYTCGPVTGGVPAPVPPLSRVASVRAAGHAGYDRFVIDLGADAQPRYEARPQASPTFALDPSAQVVTLQGSSGLLVVLRDASNHDRFIGPTDVLPGLATIREARLIGDSEGIVSWALGTSRAACVNVRTLSAPTRLVIDVMS